jgi:ATP-dependent DNA helicase RecQ
LSYFSEVPREDCGNCDVCLNPPDYFDGTIEAQMALSAVTRCNEQIGVSLLIDLLKGKYSTTIKEKKLYQIKTFGAGKKTTLFAWMIYIQQLIQQGFLEIDYKDNYHLKLTSLSNDVLRNGMKVRLVTIETIKERQERKKKEALPRAELPIHAADDDLFQYLRTIRKSIAEEIRKPAFVVFSDASLLDMCVLLPGSEEEFLQVSGVGEYKAKRYAKRFLEAISEYQRSGKTDNI